MNPVVKKLLKLHVDCDDDDAVDLLLSTRTMNDFLLESARAGARKRKRGGSIKGKKANLDRDHAAGHACLMKDYFGPIPVYGERLFRRRFRMNKQVFDRIYAAALEFDDYFHQRPDAVGRCGLSTHQTVTAALRMFCYGIAADATDEYVRIGESTAMKSFRRLTQVIIRAFGDEYLRQPTTEDVARHAKINERRGFPGMFGSLDCTHWQWKNCPGSWLGMFQDRDGNASIIMEAVATSDLWIWHSYRR